MQVCIQHSYSRKIFFSSDAKRCVVEAETEAKRKCRQDGEKELALH